MRLVAYKDSRVDMDALDEAVGAENWDVDVEFVPLLEEDVAVVVRIKVRTADGKEVVKAGVSSLSEFASRSPKAAFSDALKRAGFLYGIGRELYNFPDIVVKLNPGEYYERGDKIYPSRSLHLDAWRVEKKGDVYIIYDQDKEVRWTNA